jgi:hypothetical protein
MDGTQVAGFSGRQTAQLPAQREIGPSQVGQTPEKVPPPSHRVASQFLTLAGQKHQLLDVLDPKLSGLRHSAPNRSRSKVLIDSPV